MLARGFAVDLYTSESFAILEPSTINPPLSSSEGMRSEIYMRGRELTLGFSFDEGASKEAHGHMATKNSLK